MKSQLRRFISPAKISSSPGKFIFPRLPAHPPLALVLTTSDQPPNGANTFTPFRNHSTLGNPPRLPGLRTRASLRPVGDPTASKRSYSSGPSNAAYSSSHNPPLESNLFQTLVGAAIVAAVVFVVYPRQKHGPGAGIDTSQEEIEDIFETMSSTALPGRPDNLTAEQEEKLRQLWSSVLQLCGVGDDAASSDLLSPKDEGGAADADPQKKKRFGFRKHGKSGTSTPTSEASFKHGADEDKYGQTKQFYETLANETPETIRATIWSMVKHDHPDALLLRFLRARKWDVEKALVMLVSTMHWRHSEMHVDDDIMKNGDIFAVEDEKTQTKTKQVSKDFMDQLRMGKSFLHGTDRNGRPICVVRVRLHRQGEQCEESLERYTVYTIETARMVLAHPVDTACVIFDMTGFSMANMDYTPVKFMIKCFEANYPESLGAVLVHKAPWLFQGIWKVIRGWLDPVVASKVHFTNNRAELEEFIEPGHIIKELDGDENWEYQYIAPTPEEDAKLKDTATRDRLLAARQELVQQYEQATRDWIQNPEGEQGQGIKAERKKLAAQLREDYWNLDPYLRARSVYDRQGAIQAGGKTDWYTKPVQQVVADTSADDVD